jgi:hypothetical protein
MFALERTDLLRYTICITGMKMNPKINLNPNEKSISESIERLKAQGLWISILFYRKFA